MSVKETEDQGTEVTLLRLKVEGVGCVGDQHEFIFDPGRFQRFRERLGLRRADRLVSGPVNDQDWWITAIEIRSRRRGVIKLRGLQPGHAEHRNVVRLEQIDRPIQIDRALDAARDFGVRAFGVEPVFRPFTATIMAR